MVAPLLVAWMLAAGTTDLRPSAAEPPAKASDHWAFRPVERPGVPTGFPGLHPIDAFVRSALQARGLAPNPPAAPRDLVRRQIGRAHV